MKIVDYKNLNVKQIEKLLSRPAIKTAEIYEQIRPIIQNVKNKGRSAVIKYAKKFDGLRDENILIDRNELSKVERKLSRDVRKAIITAADNIFKFHEKQKKNEYEIETMQGIKCWRKSVPIENVGLYVPGGSAVLVSTMLMLGIPAKIANCKRVVVCSPVKNEINPALAFAARICEVDEFYRIGGAHAIAMMAYGIEDVKKVDKIFGPGNQFVTAAKTLVSIDPDGCAIDMPAGPSEVLIIADDSAESSFVAADLLSQAEHGEDSQVILVTTSKDLAEQVLIELKNQLQLLPRKLVAEKSLNNSRIILVQNLEEAIEISNRYAPEHLILAVQNPNKLINKIVNAGSVFIGNYSPESAGDYASGTNHSLPTYGYAKSYGGVNVESFMKSITFQKLSKDGLKKIAQTVITLAEVEELQAHANAIKIRLNK
ncbi:MAG: histidinol dehydrogenase [Melioribacter sp.]|uniref:histidinol dehydrogenase n=1 Tax=Rosettibacter primus TaxID=3111523 RepID=UPI00247C94FD|nr:histidinol dehydrogenase [Melioribacter sp.]